MLVETLWTLGLQIQNLDLLAAVASSNLMSVKFTLESLPFFFFFFFLIFVIFFVFVFVVFAITSKNENPVNTSLISLHQIVC